MSVTVSDLGRIGAFYRDALGFRRGEVSNHVIDGYPGRRLMMHLGEQSVELFQPTMPGNPYPEARTAHDPWFQHIAVVVSDIDRAHAALNAYDIEPITRGGPQFLPPSSGSVQAFKFRDPDGHPLELLQFPPRSGDPKWQERSSDSPFLGYDHTAIVVQDLDRSIAYYQSLGLRVTSRGVNHGSAQARLDSVDDPTVDVVALTAAQSLTPHVELLCYRGPALCEQPDAISASDIASCRSMFAWSKLIEPALTTLTEQDPDRHAWGSE
ncbi:VOC family protein [Acidisoma silvae]|uniref:VOC family protein n=1 Tax=Acidisoma silvae TaxID=2802396 RepID=A0A963YVG0_9PROT|nr:VOC family protein [Acidisoma silvae]MCB8877927.1 VOC family protein [Acidisoma silvae]